MANEFTDSNFQAEVLGSDKPVLVDFWAPWCGPCKMVGPVVEKLATDLAASVKIGKLNVDDNPNVAQEYGVMSIPTMILFKGGRVVAKTMGFQYTEIPYKATAQVITSMLAGETDFTVNSLPGSLPHIESGKFKVLAAMSAKRSPLQPNVPTGREEGIDVALNFNLGIWGPAGIPRDIVAKLNSAVAQSLAVKDVVEKFHGMAMIPTPSTPDELVKTYLNEIAFYTQAAKLVAGGK